MRTYVSTLGYDERRVTRPLNKDGIGAGDQVVVVRPAQNEEDDRAQNAIESVESYLHKTEPTISLAVEGVPPDDFEAALLACSDILRAAEGRVVVNFGGGAREVLVPLVAATFAHLDRVDSTLFFRDTDQSVDEWQLPNLTANPPAKTLETLQILATVEEIVSISELASESDMAKSTVGRHISELAAVGAVRTESRGKTKQVELTLTGELLVRTHAEEA